MWISILISAIMFAITHIPQIVAVLKAIFAFFRQNKGNPRMSGWMQEFSLSMSLAKSLKDPKPLIDFLSRLRDEVK